MSVSLILMEVVQKQKDIKLMYNVSVTIIGQLRLGTQKTLEVCTTRQDDCDELNKITINCSASFPFPSPGEVLRSEELFLEIEEASSLLQNDAMILELKLLEHEHHTPMTQHSRKW